MAGLAIAHHNFKLCTQQESYSQDGYIHLIGGANGCKLPSINIHELPRV